MAIHATAIIDPAAEIDPTAEIGPYAVIEGPARIGPRTRILAHATICRWTEIGADNVIHYGAVIGDEPQHLAYKGEERWTRIGDRNVIRENATVHRGFEEHGEGTRIGNDCYLMAISHVAHDCRLGDRVILTNNVLIGGHCVIEDGVNFGGGAAVHQFVRIGTRAMIAGMARVSKDVPPYMLAEGESSIRGLNVIGLRRAGLDEQARNAIKAAYRILCRKGLSVPSALAEIRAGAMTPEVQHMVEFIEGSKRGICRGYKNREPGE